MTKNNANVILNCMLKGYNVNLLRSKQVNKVLSLLSFRR